MSRNEDNDFFSPDFSFSTTNDKPNFLIVYLDAFINCTVL